MSGHSLVGMRRTVASAILGGLAGALSAFSHALAGGALGWSHLLVITAVSALIFAILPRRMRGLGATVVVLIALQFVAHLWLEVVHPHHHGAAAAHAHGLAGAIEHALSPGMVMMWAHLLSVVIAAALIVVVRPLLETLLSRIGAWAAPTPQWLPIPRPPGGVIESSYSPHRDLLLAHTIEGRGPPVFA